MEELDHDYKREKLAGLQAVTCNKTAMQKSGKYSGEGLE
jgi:hypothetical protein